MEHCIKSGEQSKRNKEVLKFVVPKYNSNITKHSHHKYNTAQGFNVSFLCISANTDNMQKCFEKSDDLN